MGKYDCTKARDFLHEVARSSKLSRCTDIFDCDNCPNSFTRADGSKGCIAVQRADSKEYLKMSDKEFSNIVNAMQAWSDSHPEIRKLTGDEIAVLVGLKLLGFNYIASDINKKLWAYTKMPEKKETYWVGIEGTAICISYTGLFVGIADFSDEKPLVIDEILNERK